MAKGIVSASPGAQGIEWAEYEGKLLVIEPLEVQHRTTRFSKGKEVECVLANIWVVRSKDGSKYEEFEETLIFPLVLIGQTKRKIGSYVVGRLTTGTAKEGQSAPWTLAEATPADLKAAQGLVANLSVSSASSEEDDEPEDGFEGDDDEGSF